MNRKSKLLAFVLLVVIVGGLAGFACFYAGFDFCSLFFGGNNTSDNTEELEVKPGSKDYPYIRVNQLGYFDKLPKYAFVQTNLDLVGKRISLHDASNSEVVANYFISTSSDVPGYGFDHVYLVDFSSFSDQGVYYFELLGVKSLNFL